jgi:hypothetical protein
MPEEMYQTLLTNKKQGKNYYERANLVFHLPEKYIYNGKSMELLKFKNQQRLLCKPRSIHTF